MWLVGCDLAQFCGSWYVFSSFCKKMVLISEWNGSWQVVGWVWWFWASSNCWSLILSPPRQPCQCTAQNQFANLPLISFQNSAAAHCILPKKCCTLQINLVIWYQSLRKAYTSKINLATWCQHPAAMFRAYCCMINLQSESSPIEMWAKF